MEAIAQVALILLLRSPEILTSYVLKTWLILIDDSIRRNRRHEIKGMVTKLISRFYHCSLGGKGIATQDMSHLFRLCCGSRQLVLSSLMSSFPFPLLSPLHLDITTQHQSFNLFHQYVPCFTSGVNQIITSDV